MQPDLSHPIPRQDHPALDSVQLNRQTDRTIYYCMLLESTYFSNISHPVKPPSEICVGLWDAAASGETENHTLLMLSSMRGSNRPSWVDQLFWSSGHSGIQALWKRPTTSYTNLHLLVSLTILHASQQRMGRVPALATLSRGFLPSITDLGHDFGVSLSDTCSLGIATTRPTKGGGGLEDPRGFSTSAPPRWASCSNHSVAGCGLAPRSHVADFVVSNRGRREAPPHDAGLCPSTSLG